MPPGMFGLSANPLSGRYLSLAEREEIALLRVQDHSMQEIARCLERAASTISRELRRNAATRSGGLEYRATTRSGTPSGPPVARSERSSCSTRLCASMWRNAWPVSSSLRAALPFAARLCPGKDDGMDRGRNGVGPGHGAQNRSRAVCRSTSRMMRRCASATKPSTSRFLSKPEAPAPRTDGLLADRATVAGAESPRTRTRQDLCLARRDDHPATRRGSRPRRAGTLGRRPHPWIG